MAKAAYRLLKALSQNLFEPLDHLVLRERSSQGGRQGRRLIGRLLPESERVEQTGAGAK